MTKLLPRGRNNICKHGIVYNIPLREKHDKTEQELLCWKSLFIV